MSKTITISDETFETLKDQIEKLEKPETYPIASIDNAGYVEERLILNLPDFILADSYKGNLISITPTGGFGMRLNKDRKRGTFYGHAEKQVFPTISR